MESPPASSPASFILPSRMPVIVLDDCYHFPGCHLPLFIFEARYRLMLDHALHTDRMFCVGLLQDDDDVLPVITAGLIRASVKNPDGTSQVMLYGVQRMHITGWEQMLPFRIAVVEPLLCRDVPLEILEGLKSRVLNLLPHPTDDSCEAMQTLRQELEAIEDHDAVCDSIAFHFIRRKTALRALLQECCPQKRYERLIAELAKEQE